MKRKIISSVVFALVLVAGSASADIFVMPYGGYSFFDSFSSNTTLDFSTPSSSSVSVDASQRNNAVGGGLVIGSYSENSGAIYGLNIEYISGKSAQASNQIPGMLSIEAPALAIGGFIGTNIFGDPKNTYQSILGIEIGAIMPSGKMTYTYLDTEEKLDFGETSMYISFLFMEEYSFNEKFGATATLGYRGLSSAIETIENEDMGISGGYVQEYSGIFVRLGLKIDI